MTSFLEISTKKLFATNINHDKNDYLARHKH